MGSDPAWPRGCDDGFKKANEELGVGQGQSTCLALGIIVSTTREKKEREMPGLSSKLCGVAHLFNPST